MGPQWVAKQQPDGRPHSMSLFDDDDRAAAAAAPNGDAKTQPPVTTAAATHTTAAAAPAPKQPQLLLPPLSVAAYRDRQLTYLQQALMAADAATGAAAAAAGDSGNTPGLPRELVSCIHSYLPPSLYTRWCTVPQDTAVDGGSMYKCWHNLPHRFDLAEAADGDAYPPYRELRVYGTGIYDDSGPLLSRSADVSVWSRSSVDALSAALNAHCDLYVQHADKGKGGGKNVDARYGEALAVTRGGQQQMTYHEQREHEQRRRRYVPCVSAFVAHVRELVDDWRGTVYADRTRDADTPHFLVVLDDGEPAWPNSVDVGTALRTGAAAAPAASGAAATGTAAIAAASAASPVRTLVAGVSTGFEVLVEHEQPCDGIDMGLPLFG